MASEYRWFTCATLQAAALPGPSRSVLFLEGSPDVKRNATPVTPSLLSQRETLGSASGAKHRSCGSALKVAQRTLAETLSRAPRPAERTAAATSALPTAAAGHGYKAQIGNREVRSEWSSTLPSNA